MTGDYVHVISGKFKSRRGQVLKVNRKNNSVIVKGINYKFKKVDDDEYVKRKKVVQKEYPIHVSNVALIDPVQDKPTRVKFGRDEEGKPYILAITL